MRREEKMNFGRDAKRRVIIWKAKTKERRCLRGSADYKRVLKG